MNKNKNTNMLANLEIKIVHNGRNIKVNPAITKDDYELCPMLFAYYLGYVIDTSPLRSSRLDVEIHHKDTILGLASHPIREVNVYGIVDRLRNVDISTITKDKVKLLATALDTTVSVVHHIVDAIKLVMSIDNAISRKTILTTLTSLVDVVIGRSMSVT